LKKNGLLIRRRAVLHMPALLAVAASPAAFAGPTPAAKDAYLYLITPIDGQRLRGAFWCRFGLRNMGVAPAGIATPNAGHHHLLIDVDETLNAEVPIMADKKHVHFGAGQTETLLELPRGRHTLQLVLGDAAHVPFDPPVASHKISITVL
jgi:hypothetical protein